MTFLKRAMMVLVFAAVAISSLPSHAQYGQSDQEPDHYIDVSVFADKGVIAAGDEVWIGVHQDIYPHWHTYWRNPGDSGAEAYVTWDLPEGFEIGEINWPVPSKIPYEPLLNFGYEGEATLLQKLIVPETYDGAPVTINLRTDILVCKDICIPESQDLSLTFNGGARDFVQAERIGAALKILPQYVDWMAEYSENNGIFKLVISDVDTAQFDGANLEFFPIEWGLVQNPEPTEITIDDNKITITQPRGDRPLSQIDALNGVLVNKNASPQHGYSFNAKPAPVSALVTPDAAPQDLIKDAPIETTPNDTILSLSHALLFALLGGIILNLMPCVFPVLSIKALSLVKISDEKASLARAHGLAYTAGILISFLALAGVLIALKFSGQSIGWGFQLQNPLIVGGLAYLLFIVGLNLIGAFEFSGKLSNVGSSLTQGSGLKSSFFTGVLAAIVATPCTAPFMAGAIGYALVQPAIVALAIFGALGFGLALPYLLLSFIPSLGKILPKPGAWMETFKQFLAFPMFASAAWLAWVVSIQAGSAGILAIGIGMVAIGFGVWLLRFCGNEFAKIIMVLAFLGAALTLGSLHVMPQNSPEISAAKTELNEQVYSAAALDAALQGDNPVFVEMTAAWCITCKVNHRIAINVEATRQLFKDKAITYLVGDWTNKDAVITEYLQKHGRSGVPLYVYYGKPDDQTGLRPDPMILPQILTSGIVANYINP